MRRPSRTKQNDKKTDADDVGTVEFGHLRFAQQPSAAFRAEARVAQHPHSHIPVEQRVVGAVRDAHAAAPEFGVEAVAVLKCGADDRRLSDTRWNPGYGRHSKPCSAKRRSCVNAVLIPNRRIISKLMQSTRLSCRRFAVSSAAMPAR